MKYLNTFGLLVICLCLVIGSNIIFYSPIYLYDLIIGLQPADFSIIWPGIRIFIEPFYSFAFYILALNRDFYKPVVISWILWVMGIVFIYCIIHKKSVKRMLLNMAYSVIILFMVFSFVALIPIPGPKLEKPKEYIAVDIHSHTLRSHDNVAPENISLKAHLWHGSDAFFNTEHNHSKGFSTFPADTRYKIVYPGMQMRTKDGVSIVLLSQKEFNGYDYENMSLEDLIKKAHENNMFVVMPHWWKWHEHTFAKLKDIGIDGFEIYNCGYRYFDKNEQKSMISFAKENNLTMFGVTDWHGWGYMSDVWTVFEGNTLENIEIQLLKKPKTKVLLYRREQSGSAIRFIFEPFYAFYYYISNVTLKYLISFTIWIIAVFLIFKSRFFRYIKKYLPVFMMVVCLLGIIYFCIIVRPFTDTNTIVMKFVIPALAGFFILWLILFKNTITIVYEKGKHMIKGLFKFLLIDDVLKKDIIFLKKITLFQGLSDRSLAKIALIVFKKTYLSSERIYENRHEAKVVYIIKNGQIKLTGENSSRVVESEDFFGEISLIGNHNHDCDAVALKESELYLVYRVKFEDIIESDSKTGLIIMRNLASLFVTRLNCSKF